MYGFPGVGHPPVVLRHYGGHCFHHHQYRGWKGGHRECYLDLLRADHFWLHLRPPRVVRRCEKGWLLLLYHCLLRMPTHLALLGPSHDVLGMWCSGYCDQLHRRLSDLRGERLSPEHLCHNPLLHGIRMLEYLDAARQRNRATGD